MLIHRLPDMMLYTSLQDNPHDKYENILIGVKNRDPYEDHDCIYALYGDFSLIGVEDFDPRVT